MVANSTRLGWWKYDLKNGFVMSPDMTPWS